LTIEKPAYWAVLPAGVRYDPELPASAKLLYAEISSLTNQEGYCYASNAYFEALYGLSNETIVRLLRVLEQHGYIRREDATGGKNQRRIYAGINPAAGAPSDPPSKMTPPPVKNDGGPPSKMTPVPVKNNNKSNNPPKAPQGAGADYVPKKAPAWKPERFARFWNFYPLHKSKQAAIRAWDRLKPSDELLAVIGRALERQIAEKAERGEEWKLHASTYLNNARWTDETELAAPEGPQDAGRDPGGYLWV